MTSPPPRPEDLYGPREAFGEVDADECGTEHCEEISHNPEVFDLDDVFTDLFE